MSLSDYSVRRDHFKAEKDRLGFCFPCCICAYRFTTLNAGPCRTCDHNVTSQPDDPTEQPQPQDAEQAGGE